MWKDEAGKWQMIYEAKGVNNNWLMGHASSHDGKTLTKDPRNPLIMKGFSQGKNVPYSGPEISYLGNGQYQMVFQH